MNVKWEDIKEGEKYSFTVSFDESKVAEFIKLTGDDNPMHSNAEYAKSKGFDGPIVHGMLMTSFFSRLVGKYFLSDSNLYLSQSINFKKPVLIGETVEVSGIIKSKSDLVKVLEIATLIVNNKGEEAVTGIAKVKYI